jgi:hypothetical protein
MSSKVILVGVGGTGEMLVDRVAKTAPIGQSVAASIILDTVPPIGEKPDRDHFYLGGFNVELAVTESDNLYFSPSEQRELSTFRGSINLGAAARSELGRLALHVHRRDLQTWLPDRLREAVTNVNGSNIRILVLGSLCGGTGGGVLPELGVLLRASLETLGLTGEIVGFGVAASAFEWLDLGGLSRALKGNQERALSRLMHQSEKGSQQPRGYNEFFAVETAQKIAPGSFYDLLATRISHGWLQDSQHDVPEFADEGISLLAVEGGEIPTPHVLWSSRNDFLHLFQGGPGATVPAVQVTPFNDLWGREIQEFRALLRSPSSSESQVQRFLEQHPHFLTGFDYSRAVPQVCVHSKEEGLLIPDFMLVPFDTEFADIVELKHPRAPVVVHGGKHARFAANVMQAVSQLRAYERFFDNPENRERFRLRYGFTAFKPKLTVVIGTAAGKTSELVFRRLVADSRAVNVLTYDDLLARAERYVR